MAQFDVYPNPGRHAGIAPYVVDLQSDLLDRLATRVVAPLFRSEGYAALQGLTVDVTVGEDRLLLGIQELATLPRSLLKAPVDSLAHRRDAIIDALDFFFVGY